MSNDRGLAIDVVASPSQMALDKIIGDLIVKHMKRVHALEAATGVRWETESVCEGNKLTLVAHRTDDALPDLKSFVAEGGDDF